MSIRTSDGKNFRRLTRTTGDRVPAVGIKRPKAFYTAVGGETSLDLTSLSPQISYQPGTGQLEIKSSAGPMIEGSDYYETSGTTISFPSPGLSAGEKLEIIKTLEYTGNLVADVRPDEYSEVAIVGQTVFTTDFSWPYNQNPSKRHGAIKVYLNGILQQRGSSFDYVEVQLTGANTNQIQFNSPLLGGENVSVLRLYQAIDETAAATQFNNTRLADLQDTMAKGFDAFVDEETGKIDVPYTTIVNRAKIPNLASDLSVRYGIERIPVQAIAEVQDEFGPNGERVFKALNDERGLIRFVGSSWVSNKDANGQFANVNAGPTDHYAEITFYGTSLNVLIRANTGSDMRASVDGGAEGANFLPNSGTQSGVLSNRNYSPNIVVVVTSDLSLGIHTVKIRHASAGAACQIYGFEIIGPSVTLAVQPGSAYVDGKKQTLLTQQLTAYSSGFTNVYGTAGTRGGRVLTYLAADGTVKKDIQYVNTAAAYTTSANHTNEEVVRTYSWREFTAGRADDFSNVLNTGSASTDDRAFTLDDGTTTLVVNDIYRQPASTFDSFSFNNAANVSEFTFTFVGTGLDIDNVRGSIPDGLYSVRIDGTVVASNFAPSIASGIVKICSGLPYGTHTVRITVTTLASAYAWSISRFIVYGPKKPTLPSGAVELADYNLMADYVANTTAVIGTVASGVLRKHSTRELVYTGTFSAPVINLSFDSGFSVNSTTSGSSWRYTFFGTGLEFSLFPGNAVTSFSITVDGASNFTVANASPTGGVGWTSALTTGFSQAGSTLTFSASGGTITGTYNGGYTRTRLSGMTLGLHTIIVTTNNSVQNFQTDTLDIITPIHSPKSNLYGDLQNTLPVGSCALSDNRKTQLLPITTTNKAWAQAVGITSSPSTTSTSYVPLPDMSLTITTKSGWIEISYSAQFSVSTSNGFNTVIFLNGVQVSKPKGIGGVANNNAVVSDSIIIPVSAGTHKIDQMWVAGSATTVESTLDRRTLTVREL